MITPRDFFQAFVEVTDSHLTPKLVNEFYSDDKDKQWTEMMLGEKGVLIKTLEFLKGKELVPRDTGRIRETYQLDLIYCSGPDVLGRDGGYPQQLQAIIEHENGEHIEEEMWKLLFWRSPLKVIINYDWNEDSKSIDSRKKKYTETKRKSFQELIKSVNSHAPSEGSTNYLLIMGNKKDSSDLKVQWRAWAYDSSGKESQIVRTV